MSKYFSIESFGLSDIGLVRKNNEDTFRTLSQEQFYILADGMGGHRAGEVASSRAVEYMCGAVQDLIVKKDWESLPIEDLTSQIGALVENTNLWIHHLGTNNRDLSGMGTTLCSLLFHQNFVIYSHVGDSRIYRLRKGKLDQLTHDHLVFYPKLIRQSALETANQDSKESSTIVYSRRKILAQAIGTSLAVAPETSNTLAEVEDIYLLCSDGLSDLVSHEEIQIIMRRSSDLEPMATSLISRAKANGGYDNITLVLAKIVK